MKCVNTITKKTKKYVNAFETSSLKCSKWYNECINPGWDKKKCN